LRKRKSIRQTIRRKVNVVAFANLVVDHPERLNSLLDELINNSGRLMAQLILNTDEKTIRQSARNVVVDYLNKNLEKIAGGTFGFAQVTEPPLITKSTEIAQVFDPSKRLYISDMVAFEGKKEFLDSMATYLNSLDSPMYVFVNYSQDVSTESYLKRATASRPKGLPPTARYVVMTLVNIPGSVKYQLVVGSDITVRPPARSAGVKADISAAIYGIRNIVASGSSANIKLLLSQIREHNLAKKNTLDISSFENIQTQVPNLELNGQKLTTITIKTAKISILDQNSKSLTIVSSTKDTVSAMQLGTSERFRIYRYKHVTAGPVAGDKRVDSLDLEIRVRVSESNILEDYLAIGLPLCKSGFCCAKCGTDLSFNEEFFSSIFPDVVQGKEKYIQAFNIALQAKGFEYNTCERMAKICAQIIIETNGLRATTEAKGKTWQLVGKGQLLDYFKATLGAKLRWFNQGFFDSKLFKKFSMVGYFEHLEPKEIIDKAQRQTPKDTLDYYGYYKGAIQQKYLVRMPADFGYDTLGVFKKYANPTTQIEINIFNYAYGGNMGNGNHLTSNDGFNYRGRGAIQLTGRSAYESLNVKLKEAPYNLSNKNIIDNPDEVANDAQLVVYSAFIHFKNQLKNDIKKLDELEIDKVSALINTGNANGIANHAAERALTYKNLIGDRLKCK
jgi:predicted chitinase